jgi:hypothetical protein
VDEILFQVLAGSVGRYLDAAERLAGAEPSAAGFELRRMSAAWRALLALHRPGATRRGGCTGCARQPGMCSVWRVATAYFVRR